MPTEDNDRLTPLLDELSKALDVYEDEVGDRGMPFNTGWNDLCDAYADLERHLADNKEEFMYKYNQGDVLRDRITGFEGTVTARTDFYNGCVQYHLEPRSIDGKKPEGAWVDEQQIELVTAADPEERDEAAPRKGGGFRPQPR